jgi:hypothetical protein
VKLTESPTDPELGETVLSIETWGIAQGSLSGGASWAVVTALMNQS